jgi:hypothetical protein
MSIDSNAYSGDGGNQTGLSESDRHRLLAVERRRIAFEVLADHPLPMDLEELAEAIAAREAESEGDGESDVDEVMTEFYHQHLPKLSYMDIIDYDQDEKRIEGRRPRLECLTE